MLNNYCTPNGKILKFNPLIDSIPSISRSTVSNERMHTDEIIAIRYLYLAQNFTADDISFLLDGVLSPEDVHKVYLRQKTRIPGSVSIQSICDKLGVPFELFMIHARAWICDAPGRKTLPFFIPVLSEFGEDSGERMWFSVQWIRDKLKSLDGISAFMVADNHMSEFNVKAGDCVFVAKTTLNDQTIPFIQGSLYLIRGYDDALRLHQATVSILDGKPTKKFVIPAFPEITMDANEVVPENNYGRVVYNLSQYS